MLYHAGASWHTQNSQINNVIGENKKRVFYFMEKTNWTFWPAQQVVVTVAQRCECNYAPKSYTLKWLKWQMWWCIYLQCIKMNSTICPNQWIVYYKLHCMWIISQQSCLLHRVGLKGKFKVPNLLPTDHSMVVGGAGMNRIWGIPASATKRACMRHCDAT